MFEEARDRIARLVDTEVAIVADDFFDRPPLKQFRGDQLAIWQYELGRFYDIGTLYTMLAGMLNMLVVFDAWAGPMGAGSVVEYTIDAADVVVTLGDGWSEFAAQNEAPELVGPPPDERCGVRSATRSSATCGERRSSVSVRTRCRSACRSAATVRRLDAGSR